MLCMVKYLKFSWKENNIWRKCLIGILFDQDTGELKIRWLGGSALPATSSVISLLKYIIENDMGRLKEKYIPSHFRITEKYGTSGCFDVYTIYFPYRDFDDFGYVGGKIHVSMFKRFNEEVIFSGNVYYFIALLERIQRIIKEDESFEEISYLEEKEFTPWGESIRIQRKKKIEEINENNFEYEKF